MRLPADAARQLMARYQLQYLDRCLYWSLRWGSRRGETGLLVVIVDHLDEVHVRFAWPWAPRRLDDGLVRPRLVQTGAMPHGYVLTDEWGSLALGRVAADALAGVQ